MTCLAESISKTQAALLAGHLQQMEEGLTEQSALCRTLRLLMTLGNITALQKIALMSEAKSVGERIRFFAAVLWRMRQTLSALQNATQEMPLTYEAVAAGIQQRGR